MFKSNADIPVFYSLLVSALLHLKVVRYPMSPSPHQKQLLLCYVITEGNIYHCVYLSLLLAHLFSFS